jgi:hypothetical protein
VDQRVIPQGVPRFFFPVPQSRDGRGTQEGICFSATNHTELFEWEE